MRRKAKCMPARSTYPTPAPAIASYTLLPHTISIERFAGVEIKHWSQKPTSKNFQSSEPNIGFPVAPQKTLSLLKLSEQMLRVDGLSDVSDFYFIGISHRWAKLRISSI